MSTDRSATSHQPPATSDAPLRIAHIAPVATEVPPLKSGSVELMTSLLTEGLVAKGQDVTLFATADSKTQTTRSLRANRPGTPRAVTGLTENSAPGTWIIPVSTPSQGMWIR